MQSETKNSRLFCAIQVGENQCQICYNSAWYLNGIKTYNKPSTIEFFKCGHGICTTCYDKMNKVNFLCPFCRRAGRRYNNNEGGVSVTNTFNEYRKEFQHNPELLEFSKHPFIKLYKQIRDDFIEAKRLEDREVNRLAQQEAKSNDKTQKQIMREVSRCLAVCKYCKKSTFTSEIQLAIHLRAKHFRFGVSA